MAAFFVSFQGPPGASPEASPGAPFGTVGKSEGFCNLSIFRFAISALRFLSRRL